MIAIVFFILLLPYLIQIIGLNNNLKNLSFSKLQHELKPLNKFSIIIPAVDEEFEIEMLLTSLIQQFYPKDYYEILLYFDGNLSLKSTIENKFKTIENITFLGGENQNGKKKALQKLISKAKHNNIIQLDADAAIGREFVKGYDQIFRTQLPDCIIGPVKPNIETSDIFMLKFFALDFLGLQSVQIGYCLNNKANMANGTNLFFTKSAFEEVETEIEKITSPSGDDTFLVQAFFQKSKKIVFGNLEEIIVLTPLPNSWENFLEQRIRWGSKTKNYLTKSLKILAITTTLASLSLLLAFLFTIFGKLLLAELVILFFAKALIDYIFLKKIINLFQLNFLKSNFIASTLIYPFYLVFAAYKANFGSYQWKNISYPTNKKS